MKSSKSVPVFLLLFSFVSIGKSAIYTSQQQWFINLDAGESFNSVIYYSRGLTEFTQEPTWLSHPDYNGDTTDWALELSSDNKDAYIHGPQAINSSGSALGWFAITLYYQWDDTDTYQGGGYDVYFDRVFYDGPIGSQPALTDGWAGTPGDNTSWDMIGPFEELTSYTNPIPEPMVICILALGASFIRRKPKA